MAKARKILAGILTAIAMAGCEPTETSKSYRPINAEKAPRQSFDSLPETPSTLEGKIIKVQPSQLSFLRYDAIGSHEFLYVVVQGKDKQLHTLFYPYSKAILERDATINYVPIAKGRMDAGEFVSTFLEPECDPIDEFPIEAEGFITPKGVVYK